MATDLKSDNTQSRLEEGVLVSTQVSEQVKITQKTFVSGDQAWKVFEEIQNQNKERNSTDALIWNKYNGGQPYDPTALANSGQGNRYNFPTGFMTAIVDKITPVPCKIIDQARYLTSASLGCYNTATQQIDPIKTQHTEVLREKVTRAIRRWPEWKTFYTGLAQELVIIGRAFAVFLDPFTPWPKFFKTDQAFLPNGTGEHSRNIQVMAGKQDYLVHELVDFIKDKEVAADAGWDIPNCVKAINEALPKQPSDDGTASNNLRDYEDCIREGNRGSSYSGATVIPVAHVWGIEANDVIGQECKVTQYIIYRKGNHEVLFKKEDRYKRIEDVAALFTLEPGNGKFYGSRGVGRKLINPHLAIERMRNRLYDQLEMAGLVILKTDAARAPTVQFKVRHPFILTTTDAELQEQVIEANINAYKDADAMMRDWTQHAVGQYLPSNVSNDEGDREKTAREVSIDAQREAEAKVAFLSRFWGQFADLISAMQRKLLDPETTDKAAKALQQELREAGITDEEIKEFANAPAAEVVQDLTQIQAQQIAIVQAKYGNNPSIDQRQLMIRDISSITSPTIAAELILPEQGIETNFIEAARAQMIETEAMMTSNTPLPLPASPRDMHEAHLKILIPDLVKAVQGMGQLGAHPQALGKLAAGLTHGEDHIQKWLSTGVDPKMVKQYADALKQLDAQIKKLSIGAAKQMTAMSDGANQQASAQQAQPPARGAGLDSKDLISLYKDAPEKVRRQIEQDLGYTPPTDQEMQAEFARQATLKHPDLPEKIQEAAKADPSAVAASAPPPSVGGGMTDATATPGMPTQAGPEQPVESIAS